VKLGINLPIEALEVSAYTVPTDEPESDGTLEWSATTMVLVRARAAKVQGLGWSYADTATARLIVDTLKPLVIGQDAMAVTRCWDDMVHAIRNLGRPGICSMAISAVDNALWDLKARLLNVPLVALLGQVRPSVPIYGSGGFTSYSLSKLKDQLGGWVDEGIARVKMKVGRDPAADTKRVAAAREAIAEAELYVDANGAYRRKQALAMARAFHDHGVSWFEEPVSSDDVKGLRLIRDHAPSGMDISAGEYGYDLVYFRRMLAAGAVDTLQADATRCAGITGFMRVGALCEAHCVPLSSHCAPNIHAHVCCAVKPVRHLEWFHDHVRIEQMLFDGALRPVHGMLQPDLSRAGSGIEFKEADARRYANS